MNALLILIPITLVLAVLAVGVFFWAVRHDQFEDLQTPGSVPLLDEPPPESLDRGEVAPVDGDAQSTRAQSSR